MSTWTNIYRNNELSREGTIRKFRIVQTEGDRQVARNSDFYNLDAIISVGYRVNSLRATQFRQWATSVLRDNERDILEHPGKVTHEIAKAFAESEFEKYRVVQDRLYESDFDKMAKQLEAKKRRGKKGT